MTSFFKWLTGTKFYMLKTKVVAEAAEMKCARIRLQERPKTTAKVGRAVSPEQPRRYCQKRLVNPNHDEDPRWIDVLQRFHCDGVKIQEVEETQNVETATQNADDLFLTVQNLKFLGDEQQNKRSRTSFKYKNFSGNNKHRMFVKQIVEEPEFIEDDCSSQLTCYYFDDYAKYILNTDRSRPSTGKSSVCLHGVTKCNESKAVQVDTTKNEQRKSREPKVKVLPKPNIENDLPDDSIEDTKIKFHRSGKRKSLTISRVPSPETVQVIRVDVVCNYSSSSINSDYEDTKKQIQDESKKPTENKLDNFNIRNNRYANKYLLTNTVKTLDENVSGGSKVTLLCKTFKLTDRGKRMNKKSDLDTSLIR